MIIFTLVAVKYRWQSVRLCWITYPNVYYCEDRILWSQLVSIGALISVDHKLARRRIPLAPGYSKITKALTSQYSSLVSTFATSARPRHLFCTYLRRFLLGTDSSQSPILRLYLLLILLLLTSQEFLF